MQAANFKFFVAGKGFPRLFLARDVAADEGCHECSRFLRRKAKSHEDNLRFIL